MSEKLQFTQLFRLPITSSSLDDILKHIVKLLNEKKRKFYIITPNPEIVMFSLKNPQFKAILEKAEVLLPDGMGLIWASLLLNGSLKRRITGVDLMESICEKLAKQHGVVGFLGGKGGVATMTSERLTQKYPGLRVGFVGEEWNIENLKLKHIDMLFVAYGFPKQEEWISQNLYVLPITAAMAVGGAFDYISGKVPRAPKVFRNSGFEWLFRLIVQPWRIKRQLALLGFIVLVVKEKLRMRRIK